jgi:hypothetical protein
VRRSEAKPSPAVVEAAYLRRALIITAALTLTGPATAGAEEIEVEPGPPRSLGDAIIDAEPGDTIVLPAGTHYLTEGDLLEEKDLTLRGAGDTETTVIPTGGGDALEDPGVTIQDLDVGTPLQPDEGTADESPDSTSGEISTRAQIIAVIATLAIFLFVLELVRRRRLVERYALLWMSAALALLVLAIWTDGLNVIKDLMGIEDAANAIFILAFGVAFLLLLNFSVVSSRLSEETKILAQEVASLEARLRVEQPQDGAPVGTEQGPEEARAGGGRKVRGVQGGR